MDYFHLKLNHEQLNQISTLGLAHIGDGVYELMVRSWLVVHGKATNKGLHRATIQYVSAQAQARQAERIRCLLSEEEQAVFRRGRNSNPHTVSKAATREEYQTATALEALFGYLYLKGRIDRLDELFEALMEEADPPAHTKEVGSCH